MSLQGVKAGEKVVKILSINGDELASISTVAAVDEKRGLISTDTSHVASPEDIERDGVCTYWIRSGRAAVDYIPGCTSRLVAFDGQ